MCAPQGAFPALETVTGRRSLLKVAAAGGASLLFSSAMGVSPAAAAAARKKRCYVLVLDGCRPAEIGGGLMPNVQALRDGGRTFPRARSLPIMETIPNHVMMMTGMRPDRSGVPANTIYDRALGEVRTMDRARDIRVDTVIERLNRSGRTTGTVLSKTYLYGVFGARATHRWEPGPIVPVSGHAPDAFTMEAALAMVDSFDPNLVFVNLGDVDRVGHSDLTGTTLAAARQLSLATADAQVGRFVSMLKSTGRWQDSLVIVLADHSMDWSVPTNVIHLTSVFAADPLLAGKVQIAENGGAELCYWTGPSGDRAAAIARMRSLAAAHPGVLETHDRAASRPKLRLGAEAGEVVVWCKAGWRFSDPDPIRSNPVPGNHGHPASYPIPFFVTGGHPLAPKPSVSTGYARTVDVAPTVAAFFGLGAPQGGWDGTARL